MSIPERIVGEVSKGWIDGQDNVGGEWIGDPNMPRMLSQRFEEMIAVNAARGYELESWQYQSVALVNSAGQVCQRESIVAVFRRVGKCWNTYLPNSAARPS